MLAFTCLHSIMLPSEAKTTQHHQDQPTEHHSQHNYQASILLSYHHAQWLTLGCSCISLPQQLGSTAAAASSSEYSGASTCSRACLHSPVLAAFRSSTARDVFPTTGDVFSLPHQLSWSLLPLYCAGAALLGVSSRQLVTSSPFPVDYPGAFLHSTALASSALAISSPKMAMFSARSCSEANSINFWGAPPPT